MLMNNSRRATQKLMWIACLAVTVGIAKPTLARSAAEDTDLNSLSGIYLAAKIADANKDFESAAGFYRAAFKNDPDNVFLLDRSLVLTVAEGRIEDAKTFADQLARKVQANHAARLLQSTMSLRPGEPNL